MAHAGGDGLAYTGSEVETLSSFAAGSDAYTERRWVRRSDHERERELIYENLDLNDYHQQAHLLNLRRSMSGERNAFFIFHYFNLPETITAERTFVASTADHGTSTLNVSADNSRVSFAVGDGFPADIRRYDARKIIIEGLSSDAYRIARETSATTQVHYATIPESGIDTLPLRMQQTGGSFTAGETVRMTLTNPFSHSGFSDPIPVEEWLALPRSWGTAGRHECQKSRSEDFRGHIEIVGYESRHLGTRTDGIGTCDGFADGYDIFAYAGSGGRHRFAWSENIFVSRGISQWSVASDRKRANRRFDDCRWLIKAEERMRNL